MHVISSASISLVSVLQWYFFNNVEFCCTGVVSLQSLH